MAKIMLCDDSATILNVLAFKLGAAGHEIVAKAKDGQEGINMYRETIPDISLLDVTMPNKDGRECLKEILSINPSAKVIMISALKEDSVKNDCLNSGACAFVSKVSIYNDSDFKSEILAVIDTVLKAA